MFPTNWRANTICLPYQGGKYRRNQQFRRRLKHPGHVSREKDAAKNADGSAPEGLSPPFLRPSFLPSFFVEIPLKSRRIFVVAREPV